MSKIAGFCFSWLNICMSLCFLCVSVCVCVCVFVHKFMTTSFSIRLLMDTGCFHILAIVSNASINICCCLFSH